MPAVSRSICAAYPPCCSSDCSKEQYASSVWNKVYVAFQPARFIPPGSCLPGSCALTTRFHLYPSKPGEGGFNRLNLDPGRKLFSVTLSMLFPDDSEKNSAR